MRVGLRGRALRLLAQRRKPRWVVHRQIGQNLAVQFDARLLQSTDELAVAEAVQLGGGADAHDPDGAELALFLLAAAVGELQAAFDGLFCRAVELGFCEVITAGAVKYLFTARTALGTTFDARHGFSFLLQVSGWRQEVDHALVEGPDSLFTRC